MNWLVVHSDDSGAYEPVLLVDGMPEGLRPSDVRKGLEQLGITDFPWDELYLTAESHWQQPLPPDIPRVQWPTIQIQTTIRLTPEQLALIREAASKNGVSANDWMVDTLIREATTALGGH